jgi:hypothetical protein
MMEPARAWCEFQWGPRWSAVGNRQGTWAVFWLGFDKFTAGFDYQWWFETEAQQMLFTLKWS